MKRAVIYARYSSSNQTEQSIEGQIRVCSEYAKSKGLKITADKQRKYLYKKLSSSYNTK
jgi:DNA invertase Pin-like site-specific DNA recombinase